MIKLKDGRYRERVGTKYFYGHSKAEVTRKIAAWNNQKKSNETVAGMADLWLEEHEKHVTAKTVEGYAAPLKRIKSAFGGMPIADLQPGQIQALVNSIAAQGYKRTTVQRPLDVLRMICDYAIVQGVITGGNPCDAVRLPQGLRQGCRELPPDEIIAKIQAGVMLPFGLFAYLLLYTGLRKGEALALEYSDFDFANNRIHISKSVSWLPNQPVIKKPKTEAGIRTVILPDKLKAVLPQRWKGYLFSLGGDGVKPLTQTVFRRRWEAYCREAGLATAEVIEHHNIRNMRTYYKTVWTYDFTPHQLRHVHASVLLDAGVAEKDAQKLLGHASISTTMNIYTHIREAREQKTADKLNEYLNTKM